MSRIHIALNVSNLEQSVAFYTTLLGTKPSKTKRGYANFVSENPPVKIALIENTNAQDSINHLGIETESSAHVNNEAQRLDQSGLATRVERGQICCNAAQDKVCVTAPDGQDWEIYTVLDDSKTYGKSSNSNCCTPADNHSGCCDDPDNRQPCCTPANTGNCCTP